MVIPPPTANGPLHLGHLSGPYLAADVAARAARRRGERVLALGGVDVHQNYVLTQAENAGIDVDKMIDEYRRRISDAYTMARITADMSVDPQDRKHQQQIAGILTELVSDGAFPLADVTLHACADCGRTLHHSYVAGRCNRCGSGASGGSCEACGGFTSAQDLLDARCDRCGGAPRPFSATVPVLRMEDYRDQLITTWTRAQLSSRARELVAGYLADGLPQIPLAYPTDWGVPGVGPLTGLRLDVYLEVGLSTFHGVARALDPAASTLTDDRRAWTDVNELWHFNGIDNAFYFALLWPALYLALGATPAQLAGTVVNEFFTLDGSKFSTSRDHAIWVDEFLTTEDPELVRLFLAWERPQDHTSDFTLAAYEAFCDWVRPLLSGEAASARDAELAHRELIRGEHALHPRSFNPPLAVRCLFNALSAGSDSDRVHALRRALAGNEG
jgi:methionyl-tRNA synthetase